MYHYRETCRACGSKELIPVLNLGIQPLANEFVLKSEPHSGHAPLEVLFCPRCTLGQLSVVVDPQILYSNYRYVTSQSDTMKKHFELLAADISSEQTGSLVEIGSNDGVFGLYMYSKGFGPVCGIDPAKNLSDIALTRGFNTINRQFDSVAASIALDYVSKVDVVVARHVFAHIDDWRGFIGALDVLSNKNTLVCIEVPSAQDTLDRGEFDTIYHEHLSYVTVRSIVELLSDTNWHIHRVSHYEIHGGAMLLMLRRNDCESTADKSVSSYDIGENVTEERWRKLSDYSEVNREKLVNMVNYLSDSGKIVCGYGASAKSTVWINACHFNESQIHFITDTTPQKIGKFSPGTKIPIVDQSCLETLKPDYAVLFAWNFRDEVLLKNKSFIENGGSFIIPVPEMEVVGKSNPVANLLVEA